MDRTELRILERMDAAREEILSFCEDIRIHPEGGFREVRTAGKVADWFRRCHLPVTSGLAITGVQAWTGKKGGERVMVMGELDAVRSDHHPDADPITGMAHACGHHAQLGCMAGAALALSDPEVVAELGGEVVFLGVPAEEGISSGWKQELVKAGKIQVQSGGKAELVRLGIFDSLSAVLAHHVHFAQTDADLLIGNGSTNGYVAQTLTIHGKAAHAGSEPHRGVNALNAAALGFQAVAFLRETFRDEDAVRVHGVITKGGSVVNVVPDEVIVEMMIRAKTFEAMRDAAERTAKAFRHAALAIGANVEIASYPGYLPVISSPPDAVQLEAAEVLRESMAMAGHSVSIRPVDPARHNPLSTDVGDLTHLLPVLHVTAGGYTGNLHAEDFRVTDPDIAILLPAKLAALTVYRLLRGDASEARRLRTEYMPKWTKTQYLEYQGIVQPIPQSGGDGHII